MDDLVTLHRPESDPARESGASSLPADLLRQSAGRLQVMAWLYAFTFFMAGLFPMLVVPNDRALLSESLAWWAPQAIAIAFALALAIALRAGWVPLASATVMGLIFEVASSYGIAIAEFIDVRGHAAAMPMSMIHGLSWVAVWTLLFTIVIPAPPRRAVLAALASVSAVPVTFAVLSALDLTVFMLSDPGQWFFWLIFPYLLVVAMAYVGARVVYGLTTEVKRARELGSYHLVEKLGQGGMGEVWRARHRLLARPAAIKRMRTTESGGPSAEAVLRFQREAQVIASLRSPHTVNLFDFGLADDGSFYYVMELLDGLDTDKLVRTYGPVPAARAIGLLTQVCHSLSEAESHGLVHRDVKPANIFLCRYGEDFDFVKVLDFGIVKASSSALVSDAGLTADHAVNGTPAFMAPEQVIGGPVDGRADLYALGCVAYWLITGKLVFEADNAMGMLVHHTSSAPVAPSTRSELPIPPALDQIILSCLAKEPGDRPQSARELATRLQAVPLPAEWTQSRAREWWERVRP